MIVTLTLNPALDKTARIETLRINALNRLSDVSLDAGGKGINVSSMIQSLGGESIAVGFAGGKSGEELLSMLDSKGLKHDFVRINESTRTNLKIVDFSGSLTEFNERGPNVTTENWQNLESKLFSYARQDTFFVLSGSLCPGLEKDTYKKLCGKLREKGAKVFLDVDGEALKLALEGSINEIPHYVKPNQYELLSLKDITDNKSISDSLLLEFANSLLGKGLELCVVSLGEKGALFVNKKGAWRALGLKVKVMSTVGAGDSMVGALVYGLEKNLTLEETFAFSVAASSASCTTKGTQFPDRNLVEKFLKEVRLEKIA